MNAFPWFFFGFQLLGLLTPSVLSWNFYCDVDGGRGLCVTSQLNGVGEDDELRYLLTVNSSAGELETLAAATQVIETANVVVSQENSTHYLLADCGNTTFSAEALDLEGSSTMHMGKPYTYRINITTLVSDFWTNNNSNVVTHGIGLFFRLAWCNALDVFLCNPMVSNPRNATPVLADSAGIIHGRMERSSMVVTPWIYKRGSFVETPGPISISDLELQFQMPDDANLGHYRSTLHTMLVLYHNDFFDGGFFPNSSDITSVLRIDGLTNGDPTTVSLESQTRVLAMSSQVEILIYSLIAVYDSAALISLAYLVVYRKNPIILLAQGVFLVALVLWSIVAGTFAFTFMPNKDVYCALRGPFINIPFSAIGAILVARLWRVYVTLSGAMKVGRSPIQASGRPSTRSWLFDEARNLGWIQGLIRGLTFLARVPLFKWCNRKKSSSSPQHNTHAFRKIVNARETWQLVGFLSLPQVLLQVIAAGIYDPVLELDVNTAKNVGRYFCSDEQDWVRTWGGVLNFVIFLFAVLLAWQGRHLPSVFNEKSAIFNTSGIAAFLILINVVVVETTENTSTSPDASVFMQVILILGTISVVLYNIVLPKIFRALKGEKVVVGKMLQACVDGVAPEYGSAAATGSPNYLSGAPIPIHKDDPLPSSIEIQIHKVHDILGTVVDRSGYGKALTAEHWNQMIRNVAKLKIELDRVRVEFSDDGAQQENGDIQGEDFKPAEASEGKIEDVSSGPKSRNHDNGNEECGSVGCDPDVVDDLQIEENGTEDYRVERRNVSFDLPAKSSDSVG